MGNLPFKSLLGFIAGAVALRVLAVCGWAFFPSSGLFPQLARVAIPLMVALGLVWLNNRLLTRDGFSRDVLGLGLLRIHWLFIGALLIIPVIFAIAGALCLFVPFHWTQGALNWKQFGWQAVEYMAGNSGEELAFRGYLLLVLARHLGINCAMIIVAALFGLFHLPGLSGVAALKMICTTAAGSFLFAYGYFLTGSLWTSMGMHAFGNLLLHQGLGLGGGKAILKVEFHRAWPDNYDPGFLAWMVVNAAFVIGASLLYHRRKPSKPSLVDVRR